MENGWVKIHRKIIDKAFYTKSAYVHLWVHLLLSANHKPKEFIWNGKIIVIKEGQMITGRKQLSVETGIPESSVQDILCFLEKQHQIQQQKTTKYRLITIVQWEKHQQSNNKATTKQQQADTNKNDNNVKNEKNTIPEINSGDINILIKEFEGLNPASKKFYAIPTQRNACSELIRIYTLQRVLKIVKDTLPKTNGLQYFPTISTPLQLLDKFIALESAIRKYQSEKLQTKDKYKVI